MGESNSEKDALKNGLNNDSEECNNTNERAPCLPIDSNKEDALSDSLDNKHLDTEMMKQNKKRLNMNKKPNVSMLATVRNSFSVLITFLKENTGLSNLGLIVAFILFLLFIMLSVALIVVATIWPTIPHAISFPICRRSACLRSSAEILPKINDTVAPCEDFKEYACGRWLQRNPQPPSDRSDWSVKRILEYKTRDRLRQLIQTQPHPTKASSFAYKIKYLYESCMDLDYINAVAVTPLISKISPLGGWHVLRDFELSSFDLRDCFTRLHSNFGVDLFFKIDVVPDPMSGQDSIIQILPSELGLPDKSFYKDHNGKPRQVYKRFLMDVAQILGATSSDADKFSDDLFYYERRIAEITPDKRDPHPHQAANKMTLSMLKTIAASVPISDVLLSKFPEGNIHDSTEILVPYPEYMKNISILLSAVDTTSLNNYMMWKLADKFLPYMNNEIRDAIAVYRKEMFGERKPLQRWEFCIKTIQDFMGFGLAVFLQNHTNNFENDVKVVEDIFNDVMRQTKKTVKNANWLPGQLYEHINDKLSRMRLEVGFPNDGMLLSDTNLEDTYKQMTVIKRDFFQTICNGIRFLHHQQQLRLKKVEIIDRWKDAASSFDMDVHYKASANNVIVPQALLQEPFFHPDYPLPVLFGNLGVRIASSIIQAISPWDVLYASDGILIDKEHPAVNQSQLASVHPIYCLTKWWRKVGFVPYFVSDQAAQSTLIKISGVNIALKVLQSQLQHLPHIHQPALENYEDEQLFFITFTQSVCSIKSSQQIAVDNSMGNSLDDSALISVILSQVKDFARLFSCSLSNNLYTDIPCEDVF